MGLLHVPEVQSMPALLGTQNPPAACFSRQQPGVTLLLRLTQYCVLEQPVDVPVHCVHNSRFSPNNSSPYGSPVAAEAEVESATVTSKAATIMAVQFMAEDGAE